MTSRHEQGISALRNLLFDLARGDRIMSPWPTHHVAHVNAIVASSSINVYLEEFDG